MRCAQSDGIRRARTNPQGPEQVIDGSISCRPLNNARSAMISLGAGHVACRAESGACSWRFSSSEPSSSPASYQLELSFHSSFRVPALVGIDAEAVLSAAEPLSSSSGCDLRFDGRQTQAGNCEVLAGNDSATRNRASEKLRPDRVARPD